MKGEGRDKTVLVEGRCRWRRRQPPGEGRAVRESKGEGFVVKRREEKRREDKRREEKRREEKRREEKRREEKRREEMR